MVPSSAAELRHQFFDLLAGLGLELFQLRFPLLDVAEDFNLCPKGIELN